VCVSSRVVRHFREGGVSVHLVRGVVRDILVNGAKMLDGVWGVSVHLSTYIGALVRDPYPHR
jgi:hypothetical protein